MFLFCVAQTASGQEQKTVRDLALWTEIKLEKKIVRDLFFSVNQQVRFDKNSSRFEDYIAEVELQYSINKNFTIGTNGRYTRNKHYNDMIENDYRYDLNFGYETKIIKNIKFYYRLKFQKDFYGSAVFNEYLNYNKTTYRNRVKIGWQGHANHRLYSSAEIFRLTKQSRDSFFSKYRLFFGDDISTGFGEFDLAFGFDHQLNSPNPLTCYIFKVTYQFKL